jgi:integrase/recombinase XerD
MPGLRAVQRCLSPRDRVLALIPFYAGLRIGETVALDVADVHLSQRKGLIVVRSGKGGRYREIPAHPELRTQLGIWIHERPGWPGADTSPALPLKARGGRLGARGARDILARLADDAGIDTEEFTSHVLRHTFGTTLVRGGHDLVLVAELMGHRRLETTRGYALPTAADRERAINSLPLDR